MRTSRLSILLLIPALGLGLVACGEGAPKAGNPGATGGGNWGGPGTGGSGSGGSTGGGSGGGSGNNATLTFGGASAASPSSPTAVAVQWDPAVLTAEGGDEVVYDVYRADNEAMTGETLAGTTSPAVDSFLDSGLTQGQTHFYRVAARTTESALLEEPSDVVSAHLPAQPTGTPVDYATDIAPLWSRVGKDGVTTCLDCHDGVIAKPDFRTWEGVMIGVGTSGAPDSFVSPGLGEPSWRELVDRIKSYPGALPSHRMWISQVADFEAALIPWIDEGATDSADTTLPSFDEDDLADPALYAVEEVGATRIGVRFPHGQDPESVPYGPQSFDHLRYEIFGGETSNTINWDTPVKKIPRNTFALTDDSYVSLFDWIPDQGVFVVRAKDWFGNTTISEVELVFERGTVD